MKQIPKDWGDQYLHRHLYNETEQLRIAVEAMTKRIADLEAEIARLDVEKADRRGRKPADS